MPIVGGMEFCCRQTALFTYLDILWCHILYFYSCGDKIISLSNLSCNFYKDELQKLLQKNMPFLQYSIEKSAIDIIYRISCAPRVHSCQYQDYHSGIA